MFSGLHAIIYSAEAEALRAFFRDVLELPSVDAGGGWLIFAAPPTELAAHPAEGANRHELYLMCDDVQVCVETLKARGVEFTTPITEQRFGRMTTMKIPGGELSLYQPKHPTAVSLRP